MTKHKLLTFFGLILILLASNQSFAAISVYEADTLGAEETPLPINTVPMPSQIEPAQLKIYPALNFWSLFGRYSTQKGQIMWPFSGNNLNSVFYGVVEGSIANKSTGWLGGIGAGYRQVTDATYILGGYLLADYNQSPHSHGFVDGNPGIEILGDTWDVRGNVYFPLSSTKHSYGAVDNGPAPWLEETGSGGDVEVGSKIPGLFGLKAYAGAYYFFINKNGNMGGFEGRLEFPVKHFLTFEVRATHDSVQRNAIMAGARITLGGIVNSNHADLDINSRLFEPVIHNMAAFAKGYGIPINNKPSN